jgi:hypothetical protein
MGTEQPEKTQLSAPVALSLHTHTDANTEPRQKLRFLLACWSLGLINLVVALEATTLAVSIPVCDP